MKILRVVSLLIIPILVSCLPKKAEINLPPVPASPLLQALEQRRDSFSSFKALARVETVRSGKKRIYDTVGILVDGLDRVRIEAYGPLGQSLITLVSTGGEMLLRLEDGRVLRPGPAAIERMLGVAMNGAELSAVLSGNLPAEKQNFETKAFQEPGGNMMIEMTTKDAERRFHVSFQESGNEKKLWINAAELYRSGNPVYRVQYGEMENISGYLIPKKILIENSGRKASLSVVYDEAEVNVPINRDLFELPGAEAGFP